MRGEVPKKWKHSLVTSVPKKPQIPGIQTGQDHLCFRQSVRKDRKKRMLGHLDGYSIVPKIDTVSVKVDQLEQPVCSLSMIGLKRSMKINRWVP